jgi:hypothetical protein
MDKKMKDVYTDYISLCRAVVNNDNLFNKFRHLSDCTYIVETVNRSLGEKIPDLLEKEFLDMFPVFASSELYGRPTVFSYNGVNLSPTTLRYIKILQDLKNIFGDLKLDIVEVGGGYGGQCKIIHDYIKPRSYTIVDLPDVLQLQKKYLDKFGIEVNYTTKPPITEVDLLISNYAYGELPVQERLKYKKLIANSKRGYMICNIIDKETVIREAEKEYEILPEEPLSWKDNFIYVWKS